MAATSGFLSAHISTIQFIPLMYGDVALSVASDYGIPGPLQEYRSTRIYKTCIQISPFSACLIGTGRPSPADGPSGPFRQLGTFFDVFVPRGYEYILYRTSKCICDSFCTQNTGFFHALVFDAKNCVSGQSCDARKLMLRKPFFFPEIL